MNDTVAKILVELNSLFDENLTPQAITERYDTINDKFLRPFAIKIKVRYAKEYAIDEEINSILEANRALKYDDRQRLLLQEQLEKFLEERGESEATKIRIEPSGFVYEDSRIVVYLNPKIKNEASIGDLITKNRLRIKH